MQHGGPHTSSRGPVPTMVSVKGSLCLAWLLNKEFVSQELSAWHFEWDLEGQVEGG